MINAWTQHTLKSDLLVVGAGAAGLAAAVSAARRGRSVILLDKNGYAGGGAVAGYSGTFCGLYSAGKDVVKVKRIVHGLIDDFLKELNAIGGLSEPVRYGNTLTLVHHPDLWKVAADRLLNHPNIKVFYHAFLHDVRSENGKIQNVSVSTKGARLAIHAKTVIDASGDACLASLAGFPTRIGDEGKVQNPTMIFRVHGVDVQRFLNHHGSNSIMGPEVMEQLEKSHRSGEFYCPRKKIFLFPTGRKGELLCNCTRVIGEDGRELNVLDPYDHSEAEEMGRKQVLEYIGFFRKHVVGMENAELQAMAAEVGVRQTRQIVGEKTLMVEDVVSGRKFDDAIARSAWPIELHSGSKPRVEWLFDDHYEIPYGCLVPQKSENLWVAGRCLSTTHEALASARVTAQCFAYGQAAAEAACIAMEYHQRPSQVDVQELRRRLIETGVEL